MAESQRWRQAVRAWSVLVATLLCLDAPRAQAPTAKGHLGLDVSQITAPWIGDLDGMIDRRLVRVLTVYSRTLYFVDRGTPHGTAYDQGMLFEAELNRTLGRALPEQVRVQFVPMSRDELIPALLAGKGDVVMANLTVTPERQQLVAFTEPWIDGVDEIVVTSPNGPVITSVDDLSGKNVFVRESSSYYQSLLALNARLAKDGRPPVILTPAPEALEDEDLLEMASAGLVDVLVVDNHKAWFWQRVWPGLKLHPSITLRTGGRIAWAIRKDSPRLKASLDGFLATNGLRSLTARMIFRRYLLNTRYVTGAAAETSRKRFEALVSVFRKYGTQYGMDWMLMIAQGYQESRLEQAARSRVGAIGVMQVMPATGRELKVGDIQRVDPNIHAGVKYMRFLVNEYFDEPGIDRVNRHLFAFASYNAGPNRIARLRKQAAAQGLDPNKWFNNVEVVVAEDVGRETVQYVSNIFKYYVAYKLTLDRAKQREAAKAKAAT